MKKFHAMQLHPNYGPLGNCGAVDGTYASLLTALGHPKAKDIFIKTLSDGTQLLTFEDFGPRYYGVHVFLLTELF